MVRPRPNKDPGLIYANLDRLILLIGIYGMILHIMQQADVRDATAKKAHNDFRLKNLAIVNKDYPELSLLPWPVQKLIAPEIDAVPERIAQGKPTPEFDNNLTCHCGYI